LGSEFPAALQRPQPAPPRQQQVPRQARELKQAQQLPKPGLHRRHNRQWEALHLQIEEHTRVRPPQPEPQRSKRVKQLLRAFPSEPVNERRVRNKSRGSQLRQVVAAKPERDLKVQKLRQNRPLLVKRQPGRSVARKGSAEARRPPRSLRETNSRFRYSAFTANQPGS
jgi:hypothetical protein